MKRFLSQRGALAGFLAAAAVALVAAAAVAHGGVPHASGEGIREAARPGAFCSFGGCRPRTASPVTGVAFGATVLAIGWRARRRAAGDV